MASLSQLMDCFKKESKLSLHDFIINNDDIPFDQQEVDTLQNTIITNINSCLNQENTRHNGLLLLDSILNRCSKDIFSKYGLLWIIKSTQVLENVHSNVHDLTLACKVLGSLIIYCKDISELNKQISMHSIKQIINIFTDLQTDAKCGAVYYLIAVFLYHYPEVCEKFHVSIKKMILLQIDSTQENLINASAKCYVLLSKTMERSFKSPLEKSMYTRWMYDEALLCNTLHAIMDIVFFDLIELKNINICDQLDLPSITSKNIIECYNAYKQRFSNLCIYLSSMLRGYQAKNSVMPNDILNVLCRGLAITPLNLKNRNIKEQTLYIILPKLHISLLSVLDAFINGFAKELIPYGTQILLLFQQILQWTSTMLDKNVTFSNTTPFKSVKIHTYKCFSSWLMNTNSLSGIETIANKCIVYILKDIIPERNCILLTVQQKMQHSSKRAVKRFKDSQYENSSILNNEAISANKNESLDTDLCKEALVALQNILSSGSILLKPTFYKNVQNSVIPLLHNLYLNSSEQNFYKIHNECRLELFKVLKALQMNPHITLAFPMQYCLEISHMATYDIDLNISQEAKLALAELEKVIHPAAPTLKLSRQESNNEFIAESQLEDIVNRSDKKNRIEEEFSSNADEISYVHPAASTLKLSRHQESNNEFIAESQLEDIVNRSDKKNRIEEEFSSNADEISYVHPAASTLKLSRHQESNNEFIAESQLEDIVNRSDKKNRIEEEFSSNADEISYVHPAASTLKLSRHQESNNEFIAESQIEDIVNRSDKKNRIEEEFSSNADEISYVYPAASTLKLSRHQKSNNEFIAESQIEDIVNRSDKRKIEEEFSLDADEISCLHKRARIIELKTETIQIEKSTESIQMNDSMINADKSSTENTCVKTHNIEEQKTGNVLQEQEKTHCDKKNQSNIDKLIDVESRAEYELTKHVINEKKQDEQPEDSASRINEINKVQKNIINQDIINEEKEKLPQNNVTNSNNLKGTMNSFDNMNEDNSS